MTVRILDGDVRERLRDLPDASVQCCVTSPPYYGLRDYGVPGQLGLEPTLAGYIATMVSVFRDVRRVLCDDGTLWLNCGDSYNAYNGGAGPSSKLSQRQSAARPELATGFGLQCKDLKPKDLMMVPARLAIALQDDGWYLRSDIIWHKPNPMPESVQDRPTSAHEHIFLLTKNRRYYYDADAIRTAPSDDPRGPGLHNGYSPPGQPPHHGGLSDGVKHATLTGNPRKNPDRRASRGVEGGKQRGHSRRHQGFNERWNEMPREEQLAGGANARNVWTIATKGFSGAHFAVFPEELARRCIAAGTKQGDVVLDPFLGSGTTLLVADRMGRDGIGIELNPTYAAMARRRIEADCPLFVEVCA